MHGNDGEFVACSQFDIGSATGAACQAVWGSVSARFGSPKMLYSILRNAHSDVYIQRYFLVAFAGAGLTHVAVVRTAFNAFSNLPNDRFSGVLRSQWKVKRI